MARQYVEHGIQSLIVDYLLKRQFFVFAIPNGAHLAGTRIDRAKKMARLKKEGLRTGMMDLGVLHTGNRSGFIEVKKPGEPRSAEQIWCAGALHDRGQNYALVESIEDVDAALKAWGWI